MNTDCCPSHLRPEGAGPSSRSLNHRAVEVSGGQDSELCAVQRRMPRPACEEGGHQEATGAGGGWVRARPLQRLRGKEPEDVEELGSVMQQQGLGTGGWVCGALPGFERRARDAHLQSPWFLLTIVPCRDGTSCCLKSCGDCSTSMMALQIRPLPPVPFLLAARARQGVFLLGTLHLSLCLLFHA